MKIWIMRHGEAGFNGSADHERTLTTYGKTASIQQGEWLAKRLANQNIQLDKVLVSPYTRAQQTLESVLEGMQAVASLEKFAKNPSQIIEEWQEITPYGYTRNVLDYAQVLRDEEGIKNLLIVSHLPLVFDLVEDFTQNQAHVHFYPAVIAEVDWSTDAGKLITSEKP